MSRSRAFLRTLNVRIRSSRDERFKSLPISNIDKDIASRGEAILATRVSEPDITEKALLYQSLLEAQSKAPADILKRIAIFGDLILERLERDDLKIHWIAFILSLQGWMNYSDFPELSEVFISDLIEYGSAYADMLKKYRLALYFSSRSEYAVEFEVDLKYLPEMSRFDDLITEDILPHYIEKDEDPMLEVCYEEVDVNEETKESFRSSTRSYLEKFIVKDLEIPDDRDYRMKMADNLMFDPSIRKSRLAVHISAEHENLESMLNCNFAYSYRSVPVGPANTRYVWMNNINAFVSHQKYETIIQQIISKDRKSVYGKEIDIDTFPVNRERFFGLVDYKKAGLSIPLWLIDIISEEIDRLYNVDMTRYIDAHRRCLIYRGDGIFGVSERGFGLGNMNALMTLCQCIVAERLNIQARLFNDDSVFYVNENTWFHLLEYLEELGWILSYPKCVLLRDEFVLCEEYHPSFPKDGYFASHLMHCIWGHSIVHSKEKFISMMSDFNFDTVEKLKKPLISYIQKIWGHEFSSKEIEWPPEFGGWFPCKSETGFNNIFRFIADSEDLIPDWTRFKLSDLDRDLPVRQYKDDILGADIINSETNMDFIFDNAAERNFRECGMFEYAYEKRMKYLSSNRVWNKSRIPQEAYAWRELARKRKELWESRKPQPHGPQLLNWYICQLTPKATNFYSLPRDIFEGSPTVLKTVSAGTTKIEIPGEARKCFTIASRLKLRRDFGKDLLNMTMDQALVKYFGMKIYHPKGLKFSENFSWNGNVCLRFCMIPQLLVMDYCSYYRRNPPDFNPGRMIRPKCDEHLYEGRSVPLYYIEEEDSVSVASCEEETEIADIEDILELRNLIDLNLPENGLGPVSFIIDDDGLENPDWLESQSEGSYHSGYDYEELEDLETYF